MIVTKVEKLEPLALRKEWMNDLAQAVAFLESLNLAHGDLRPENILLDRDRVKLSDFDCAAEIGSDFEACIAPYGRILNGNEADQGRRGTPGLLGPRTAQFALGSLYYLVNYGFEVYGDRCLTEDPREHGPKVVDLLQDMESPKLNGDPLIDDIIDKCWHYKYATLAELAAHTKRLLGEGTDVEGTKEERTNDKSISGRWRTVIGRVVQDWRTLMRQSTIGMTTNSASDNDKEPNGDSCDKLDQDHLAGDFVSKKAYCQDLEKRGLLHLLCSGEPEQLGFTFDWYRYSL